MTARDLAHHAFYTEHPLVHIFQLAHGHWDGRQFIPAAEIPLRKLIAFAETLPGYVIDGLSEEQP